MAHDHSYEAFKDIIATFSVERQSGSRALIRGEIPTSELAKHEAHVLVHLGADIELKGFRKGHIPPQVLRTHIGELTLFTEVAEHTLSHMYPGILKHFNLDAIGKPSIHAEKLVPGNPFGFRIEIALVPDVTLPDYVSIAKTTQKESVSISDTDLATAIERIQRQKLSYERLQEKAKKRQEAEAAKAQGITLPTPETVEAAANEEDVSSLPLPELTDAYVQTLGAFTTVDDFKAGVRKHLNDEKQQEAQSKHRGAITSALIAQTTIDLPDVLIRSELSQMFGQMEDDLKRAGLTLDGYLEHVKKTREQLEQEWTPAAEKRAKTQLILNAIATKEKIESTTEDIEREAKPLLEHYADADPVRVRVYVASVLQNEAVMKFLESQ